MTYRALAGDGGGKPSDQTAQHGKKRESLAIHPFLAISARGAQKLAAQYTRSDFAP
jgi:hypothetical protein